MAFQYKIFNTLWADSYRPKVQMTVKGLHYYCGPMKMRIEDLKRDYERLEYILNELNEMNIKEIEYGGGIGIDYYGESDHWYLAEYMADQLKKMSKRYKITYEAGRLLAADAGSYIARVVEVRKRLDKIFVIINGGRHHFTYHGGILGLGKRAPNISVLQHKKNPIKIQVTIVGALCTAGDILANGIEIPEVREGDYIVFRNAGAYCNTEGTALFLSRDLPGVLLQDDETIYVKRQRNVYNWLDDLYLEGGGMI